MESTASQLKNDIRAAREELQTSRALEDAVRLQAVIEERRASERSRQKKEARRVIEKSRLCRAFYQEQFANEREEFQNECKASVNFSKRTVAAHKRVRVEEQRLLSYELRHDSAQTRRQLKDLAHQREGWWKNQWQDHREKTSDRTLLCQQALRRRQELECSSAMSILNESGVIGSEKAAERAAQEAAAQAYSKELCSMKKLQMAEQQKKREQKHAEERKLKAESNRVRWCVKAAREHEKRCVRLESNEQSKRYLIVKEMMDDYLHIVREFKEKKDHLMTRAAPRRLPLIPPTPETPSKYSLQWVNIEANRKKKEATLMKKRTAAQENRCQRLNHVLGHVRTEGSRINALRMETLERRRGEKAATECEPYVVAEGVSNVREVLPDSAREKVLSILRESDL